MFLNYINAFRALSIFFIVSLHVMLVCFWGNNLEQQKILHITLSNGTALFIFIGGYLFQHLSPKFDTRRYYISKFKYVLLPYLVVSMPLILYYVFISSTGGVSKEFLAQPAWLQIFYYYWHGLHLFPMWFVPMMAIFYFTGPLLIRGDRTKVLYWLLPVFILMSLVVQRSQFPTNNFLHFFSYYALGMFCSKYKSLVNPVIAQYRIILLFAVGLITLYLVQYFVLMPGFKGLKYVQTIFLIFTILGLLIKFEHLTKSTLISIVANTSFGIYFVHAFVLQFLQILSSIINRHSSTFASTFYPGNILLHFLVTCITMLLSILLVLAIKRLLGDKTYILIGNVPSIKNTSR